MGDQNSISVAMRPARRLLQSLIKPLLAARQDRAVPASTPKNKGADLADSSAVFFVPTESALLLKVTLPKMAASQRRLAVQFAVEDQIAQPLDMVHVVLGPRVEADATSAAWLVAVISNTAMETHNAAAPHKSGPMVLDVLALQVPRLGQWSVLVQGERVLVRLPDWSGFATSVALMPGLWAAAGSPGLVVLGDEFPFQIEASSREALATTLDPKMMTFDLRAGRYARRGAGWPTGARALAATAAVACIGHLSLLGLDIVALQRNVVAQETKVRQALDKAGAPFTGDVDSALTAALATQIPAKTGGFLPLLAQSFSAISAQAGLVQVKDMRFSQANAALTLTIEAPDLTALQAIETAFVAAGLQVAAGAATTGDGAAEAQMIVSAAAP